MLTKYLSVFLISMVPLIELRGAIPVGVAMGLPLWQVYVIAIIGNMLPVPFIFFFARKVLEWGADKPVIGKFFTFCLEKGHKGGAKLKATAGRGLPWALLLFVGIPLPGTGAWTGTLAASSWLDGANVAVGVVRLAALLPVLCYHYCIEAARLGFAVPTALIGRGMADWVEVGLAWFFLLSGAALCLQWQGRFDARRYFVGRAAATYPAFWLGFGALFLYGEVLHGNNADIPRWRAIFSVLGLDGYLAPVTVTFYKIGEWFLGVILILYLVFPLLLRCMETAAHRRVLALCMAVLAVVWPLVCPAPWEAGHTVLGRLPAFALGVWFGTLLKKNALPSYRLYIGLAVCPLLWVDEVPRLAVLLVLASVLFWAVYAAGQHVPAPLCPALRRLAGWCYGVYLVHHVLLTLVFLPFVQGHGLPLAGMFPVYLAASFVPAAVLTAVSRPLGKAIKKLT